MSSLRCGALLRDPQARAKSIRLSAQQITIRRFCLRDITIGNVLGVGRTPLMLTQWRGMKKSEKGNGFTAEDAEFAQRMRRELRAVAVSASSLRLLCVSAVRILLGLNDDSRVE